MGQLGLGEDVMEKIRPALVDSMKDVTMVKAGGMHVVALDRKGDIHTFGCNDDGALGRITAETEEECVPQKVELAGKAVQISAGDSHSACLLEDGRVFIWGNFRNSSGPIGLTMEGGKQATPVQVLNDKVCVAIASGSDHILMLTDRGELYSMGNGEQGQLGRLGALVSGGSKRRGMSDMLEPARINIIHHKFIDRIWATNSCSFYRDVKTDAIYGFGLNNNQQVNAKADRDKKENVLFKPVLTKFGVKVDTLAGGMHHTMALHENGTVHVIGRRDYGRLGLGENLTEDLGELTEIATLKGVKKVGCGDTTSYAITSQGDVYSWGMGTNHQLGHGTDTDCHVPTQIVTAQTKAKRILDVDAGGQHTVFIVAAAADDNKKNKE